VINSTQLDFIVTYLQPESCCSRKIQRQAFYLVEITAKPANKDRLTACVCVCVRANGQHFEQLHWNVAFFLADRFQLFSVSQVFRTGL